MTHQSVDAWTPADIPDQAGRTVVVTGPSAGGIGYHAALELARRGARVVLAGRSPDKLEQSAAAIRREVPGAQLERLQVDLSDFASVRRAAVDAETFGALDLLVNNAGVLWIRRTVTDDGLDLQLATNHFGPFLLTGLLLPQLVASGAGTVVTVSSIGHRAAGSASLGDPRRRRGPASRWTGYFQSKLANLLFTYALDRRAREGTLPVTALAAHPGLSGTHLASNGQFRTSRGGRASILDAAVRAVAQPAAHGAWPVLMAATADLPGSTFVGPGGLGELGGTPQVVTSSAAAHDEDEQDRLWRLSEEVTGESYPRPPG